ncbi:hypothetical protein [Agrobacterium vitis]|uniref:hypothetical protein n=1 Tax=Agrobacterium vitis TaxID=373 RepID=UPI0018D1FB47|nr:hypothetical protein [Agrobacterium vitis]
MASFEEECIERYFLKPGNNGPVGSIYVADEDLPELFGVTDLDEARRLFVRSLPAMSIVRDYLTGHMTLLPGRISPALKILLFLCWMQTTKTRVKGDREFREMFESHTGYRPANMNGLNGMWDRLRDHFKAVYDVDLNLPEIYPYVQIGRTLRIAFPTWRDKEVLRKLRDDIRHDLLLDPLTVSGKVSTSRHVWDEKMPSLEYNFHTFERTRKRGGREYVDTAFWHAWYDVVAEKNTLEELELVESDFGEYELFVVSPIGERKPITDPEQARAAVPKLLAKAIKDGKVFLESLGFGKFRAQTKTASSTVLMRKSKLSEQPPDTIRFSASINHTWVLASFRDSIGQTPVASGSREFGWYDGIRVGGGYLGRAPLTPLIAGPLLSAISVEVSGKPVDLIRVENAIALAPGTYSGIALAKGAGGSHEVLMIPRAGEIGDARRLAFDLANDIPEDEFHFGTAPSILVPFEPWRGERSAPSDELITISEALYERTARGLPLSEAVDIVRKGISRTEGAPSEWEILRSFADAGWFESTFQRRFPARRLLQRALSYSLVGDDAITIDGPTPLAVLDRLRVAAVTAGGILEEWFGPSEWVLPRYLVRTPDLRSQQEFLRRAALPPAPAFLQAKADKADTGDTHGYEIVGKLREDRGYFATSFASEMVGGLYRLDRPGSNSHFLYRSVVAGKQDQNYLSPSVALLAHHLRTGGALFALDKNALSAIPARTYLPSSWARWLSNSSLCNAGPRREKGGWRYEYPVAAPTVSAIAKLLPIQTSESTTTLWIDRFLLSASNRKRAIHDSRAGRVRSAAPRINEKS